MGVITGFSFEAPINSVYISTSVINSSLLQVIDYSSGQETGLDLTDDSLATVETTYTYSSERTSLNGAGFSSYRLEASGSLTFLDDYSDTFKTYGANISTMARVTVSANEYLYSGSAYEHGLDVYKINSNGDLDMIESVGPAQLLPIRNITQIVPVVMGGQTYLIVATSGSSSLFVWDLHSNGTLSVTDHVVETQDTRLQSVNSLKTFQKGGQDLVHGHESDDTIYGGLGNDRLYGGTGNDSLFGSGNTTIEFGYESIVLSGTTATLAVDDFIF